MARNIYVDGLFLTRRYSWCGINRYLVNLLRSMVTIDHLPDDFKLEVLVPSLSEVEGFEPGDHEGFELVSCPAMRLRKLWRFGVFLGMTKALRADALFLPSPAPVQYKPFRLAVTVHDVIPVLFPDKFRSLGGRLLRRSVASSLSKADLIFTDSEYSKSDILSSCAIPPARIVVTHLGFDSTLFNPAPIDLTHKQEVLSRLGIKQPYLLHVGAIEPRKNLARLVRAYRLLASRDHCDFQLVLCGRLGWGYQELLDLIKVPELQGRIVRTGAVPDRELAVLYKGAVGCVMPSLYEGFGLPLLEAMASGVPVITSDRSCLPEIAGDAAVYFNPESVEEMSDAMERVLSDSALRHGMIDRGLKRAQLFSWEDCARKTLAALREL